MPDQPTPARPTPDDLDDRIRTLVTHAVSDAPPAPELGAGIRTLPPPRRSPWLGPAVLMAAAAVIGALVIVAARDGRHDVVTRDTTTVPVTTVDAETSGSPTSTVSTEPPTIPADISLPDTGTTIPVSSTSPPTRKKELHGESVVVAGPEGVYYVDDSHGVQDITHQPMQAAVEYPTGPGTAAIVMQKRSGYELESTPADTTLMIWRSSTHEVTPLLADPVADGFYRLYDVAVVDGVPTLLFAVEPMSVDITTPPGKLYVMSMVDMVPVEVGEVGGWEAGTSRLHLASNGVIVGGVQNGPTTAFASWSIGSAPAITAQQLGLDPNGSSDCPDCPHAFTISRDGSTVAWIDGGQLELRDVATGDQSSAPLPAEMADDWSLEVSTDRQLVIGNDQPSSFLELAPPRIAEPFGDGTCCRYPGTWIAFGTSRLPQNAQITYPGVAWHEVTDVTLADSYASADAATQALHDALVAHADGEPRLRRDDWGDPNLVVLVWTNVPDDSVVEQYYVLLLTPEDGGVRVFSFLTASLGRDGLICGAAGDEAFGNGPDTVASTIVCP